MFAPDSTDELVFRALRARATQQLREGLLERVELLRVRFREPRLRLTFYPVWELVYRYRRVHGNAWVSGACGRVGGKSVSLLHQWLGGALG